VEGEAEVRSTRDEPGLFPQGSDGDRQQGGEFPPQRRSAPADAAAQGAGPRVQGGVQRPVPQTRVAEGGLEIEASTLRRFEAHSCRGERRRARSVGEGQALDRQPRAREHDGRHPPDIGPAFQHAGEVPCPVGRQREAHLHIAEADRTDPGPRREQGKDPAPDPSPLRAQEDLGAPGGLAPPGDAVDVDLSEPRQRNAAEGNRPGNVIAHKTPQRLGGAARQGNKAHPRVGHQHGRGTENPPASPSRRRFAGERCHG